jgi:hypothetical protein
MMLGLGLGLVLAAAELGALRVRVAALLPERGFDEECRAGALCAVDLWAVDRCVARCVALEVGLWAGVDLCGAGDDLCDDEALGDWVVGVVDGLADVLVVGAGVGGHGGLRSLSRRCTICCASPLSLAVMPDSTCACQAELRSSTLRSVFW